MIRIKRRWMVVYSIKGGIGRVFLTTKSWSLRENLIREMDEWLNKTGDEEQNAFVTGVTPVGFVVEWGRGK